MTTRIAVVVSSCLLASSGCSPGFKPHTITYDNRREGTVAFVAELDDGEVIELVRLSVADGGGHIPADQRVFDDSKCSTRPIQARTLEGEVLFEYPVGTCNAVVLE